MTLIVSKPAPLPIISEDKEEQITAAFRMLHAAVFDYSRTPAGTLAAWTEITPADLRNGGLLDVLQQRARVALNELATHREQERVAAYRGSVDEILLPHLVAAAEAREEYAGLSDSLRKMLPKLPDYVSIPMSEFSPVFEGTNEAEAVKILVALSYKVGKLPNDKGTYVFAPIPKADSK
jgi:hypothetical protein